MLTHQHLAAASRLRDAEAALPAATTAAEAGAILGQIAILRGGLARYSGNLALSVALARQALDLLPETEFIQRQAALMTVAQGFQVSGDVTAASERLVLDAIMPARASSNVVVRLRGISLLAQLRVMQGRLREALDIYAEAAQITPGSAGPEGLVGSPYYFFGLGDLLRERCDLDEADRILAQGMDLIRGALVVFAETIMLGYVALANLQRARGEYEAALRTLQAFTNLAQQRRFTPLLLSQAAARQARIELAQGNLAAALIWRDGCGLSADDDDLTFSRLGEYLTLARVRIAEA